MGNVYDISLVTVKFRGSVSLLLCLYPAPLSRYYHIFS